MVGALSFKVLQDVWDAGDLIDRGGHLGDIEDDEYDDNYHHHLGHSYL